RSIEVPKANGAPRPGRLAECGDAGPVLTSSAFAIQFHPVLPLPVLLKIDFMLSSTLTSLHVRSV
ncbi:hypothetical protein HAX54_051933, partial [Datura stramonium]|nr:hypothetical protein [Datura stramonium]